MFSYVFVLTMVLHILSVDCARKQKCPSNGFRSVDTNECYCYEDGTPQLCRRQSSKGARFISASQKLPSKHRSNGGFSARIVGGELTTISKHPYMLAMEVFGRLKCGATIIGHWWALTAAHCIASTKYIEAIRLWAHTENLFRGGETFSVVKTIVHEGFELNSIANDIALIKADRPFESGGRPFSPALLPEKWQELTAGSMVTVVGWGNTEEHGRPSLILREVKVPIVSHEYCQTIHGFQITTDIICAGYPEGKKDACQADSGGPMMYHETIVGIVSSGDGCARQNSPGVYTKVSAMRDWISKKDACQADSGGPMMYHGTIVGIVSSGDGCARQNSPGVYTKVSAMRDWISSKI